MIKVLWVEDNEELVKFTQYIAKSEYELQLCHFSNWEDGLSDLDKNFNDYYAIILDAHCVLKNGEATDDYFLVSVSIDLQGIFSKYKTIIPWFIYSAGDKIMDNFEKISQSVIRRNRNSDWGKAIYLKTVEGDRERLFEKIVELAPQNENFKIKYQYSKLFEVLDCPGFLDPEASDIMLRNLKNIGKDENSFSPKEEFNQLRKVFEYIFRTAHTFGLLPEEYLNEKNGINLDLSCRFLNGAECTDIRNDNKDKNKIVRFGDKNEYLFPKAMGKIIDGSLTICQTFSHTNMEEFQPNLKYLYLTVIQTLSATIEYFGDYCEVHNKYAENKGKIKYIDKSKK